MESTSAPLSRRDSGPHAQLYRSNFLLFAGIFSVYAGVLVLNLLQIGLGELLKFCTWGTLYGHVAVAGIELLLVFLLFEPHAAISRAWLGASGRTSHYRARTRAFCPPGRYLWL